MMKTFATLAAFAAGTHALVGRGDSCCFHLTASGGASGSVGQLSDSQNRIGDNSLTPADYCINSSGGITDSNGSGCILTPPTTQFQCDKGASPTTGFSIASNGELEYNGSPSFIACETGQNGGLNIYTTNSTAVTMCKRVTLKADSCSGSGAGAPGASPPAASSAVSSAVSSAPAHSSPASSAPAGSVPGASAPAGSAPSVPGGPASSAQCLTGAPVTTTVTVTDCSCATGAPGPGGSGVVGGGSAAPNSSAPVGAVGGGSPAPSSSVPTGATGHGSQPSGSASGTPAHSSSTPAGAAGGGSQPAPSSSVTPSRPAGGAVSSGQAGGSSQLTPSSSVASSRPAGSAVSSGPAGGAKPSTLTSVPASSASSKPSPVVSSGSHCPTTLSNGNYQYPHLIVPIDSSSPNSAPGTSYNGTVTSTISTIFNFDIPQDYSDNTCSLVFLFPKKADLETSSYSFSGDGKIDISKLSAVATQSTDYSNAPSVAQDLGYITISPGNSYVVSTFACPAGQTVAYEMKNAGSTNLNFFEDWNPSPLGLFITTC